MGNFLKLVLHYVHKKRGGRAGGFHFVQQVENIRECTRPVNVPAGGWCTVSQRFAWFCLSVFKQAQNGSVIANFQINITAKHDTKNRQYTNRFLILTVWSETSELSPVNPSRARGMAVSPPYSWCPTAGKSLQMSRKLWVQAIWRGNLLFICIYYPHYNYSNLAWKIIPL